MRQILALCLVLALVGSTLANIKKHRSRDTPYDRIAKKSKLGTFADEIRQNYMRSKDVVNSEALRKKYAGFGADQREKMAKLNARMMKGAKISGSRAKGFLNGAVLRDRMEKAQKMRPEA